MANLLFTQRCVRTCPYCFAGKQMSGGQSRENISWEDLIYAADLYQADGHPRIPILGGEPTLHPQFCDMLIYLLERGFELTVFTSGVISENRLREMAALFSHVPGERLGFLCNLNDPVRTPGKPGERERVERFLAALGEKVTPGFNIYSPDFSLDFIFDDINRFGLIRTIRLGLSHPIFGFENAYVKFEEMDAVIDCLFDHAEKFERFRVAPGLDCGFPMCRFTDEQMAWIARNLPGGGGRFTCGPVVDIGPDLTVWPCFPLSGFNKRSLYEFDSLKQVQDYYLQVHEKVRVEAGGIFPECDTCRYRELGQCSGGCIAHLLKDFADEPRLRLPEVYA